LTVTTTTPATGNLNTAYSATLIATGGSGTGYKWSIASGALPTGLTLATTGAITGKPTIAETSKFPVKVVDSASDSAMAALSIIIDAGLTIATTALPTAHTYLPYTAAFAAADGSGAGYKFSVSAGALPTGLTLATTGDISGKVTTGVTSKFTVNVTDSANHSATAALTLTVDSALDIVTTALPTGFIGVAYFSRCTNFVFYPSGVDRFEIMVSDPGYPNSGAPPAVLIGVAYRRTGAPVSDATGLVGTSVRSRYFLTDPGETTEGPGLGVDIAVWNGKTMPADTLANIDVVITSYGSLLRFPWLTETSWRLAVLDEAQAIKNPNAKQTRSVRKLKAGSRIALTGTPVENRLGDLWSIFDLTNSGLLGTAKEFTQFTKRLADRHHNPYGPLRELVRPYILQRLKTDKSVIADLPDKTKQASTAKKRSVPITKRKTAAATKATPKKKELLPKRQPPNALRK